MIARVQEVAAIQEQNEHEVRMGKLALFYANKQSQVMQVEQQCFSAWQKDTTVGPNHLSLDLRSQTKSDYHKNI